MNLTGGGWVICQHSNFLLFLFLVVLIGCSATEIRNSEIKTVVIQPGSGKLAEESSYALTGRLSVHNLQQKFSATVNWQHRADEDQILLFSPLGQTIARIEQDISGVRLITAEPALYQAENIERLTQQVLGWVLPLSGLHFWVRGFHSPLTIAELDLDRNGRIIAIRQDGWNIYYSIFFPLRPGMQELPKLLELSRDNLKIKLVIDRWIGITD
ncbi:MAG: outer membrane lipoprotein LolB [Nitrosomonas sp.]|nr:outer membrane lipoprotein LolB [Nitrosomonas sp.]